MALLYGRTNLLGDFHVERLADTVQNLQYTVQQELDRAGRGILVKTASFGVGERGELLACVDATAGDVVATLRPASETRNVPYQVVKIDSGSNKVTLTASGADTINGATTLTLSSRYDFAEVVSDGVLYLVKSRGGTALGSVREEVPSRLGNVFTTARAYQPGTLAVYFLGSRLYKTLEGTAQWSETSASAGTFTLDAAFVTASIGAWDATYHNVVVDYEAAD